MDDRAASPVMGAIIMVSITVVLAAGAFALFRVDAETEKPPVVGATESDDSITITRVANGPIDWADVAVTGCTGVPTGTISAGDTLTGCTGQVLAIYNGVLIIDRNLG